MFMLFIVCRFTIWHLLAYEVLQMVQGTFLKDKPQTRCGLNLVCMDNLEKEFLVQHHSWMLSQVSG